MLLRLRSHVESGGFHLPEQLDRNDGTPMAVGVDPHQCLDVMMEYLVETRPVGLLQVLRTCDLIHGCL